MRLTLALLLFALCCASGLRAQSDFVRSPMVIDPDSPGIVRQSDEGTGSYDGNRGVGLFNQGRYAAALSLLRRDFQKNPGEESARYYYYSLLYLGHDLEAAAFKHRNAQYAFAIPEAKTGLESVYGTAGVRLAENSSAAENSLYGEIGAVARIAPQARIWAGLNRLQFDQSPRFSQTGGTIHGSISVANGWTIAPNVQYARTSYSTDDRVLDSLHAYNGPPDTGGANISYVTRAAESTDRYFSGRMQGLFGGVLVQKRLGRFEIGLEPAVHAINGSDAVRYSYTALGVTDSFSRGNYRGTKPYTDTITGSSDSGYQYVALQAGGSVGIRFSIGRVQANVRAGGFYQYAAHASGFAWTFSSLFQLDQSCWLYLGAISKSNLPLALSRDGLYLSYSSEQMLRGSLTLQLFPLRRWSPALTYQLERNQLLYSSSPIRYHSGYLTIRCRL